MRAGAPGRSALIPAQYVASLGGDNSLSANGRIMGWKKTAVFCTIIVVIPTVVGMGFGWLVG